MKLTRTYRKLATQVPGAYFLSLSTLSDGHEKLFVKRLCGSSNENQGKHFCFLDAIGRRSCSHQENVGKSKLQLKRPRIETAGWFATVRFVISFDFHFNSRSSLACLSSACISLGMQLKAKFTPAVSSIQFLTKRKQDWLKKGFIWTFPNI